MNRPSCMALIAALLANSCYSGEPDQAVWEDQWREECAMYMASGADAFPDPLAGQILNRQTADLLGSGAALQGAWYLEIDELVLPVPLSKYKEARVIQNEDSFSLLITDENGAIASMLVYKKQEFQSALDFMDELPKEGSAQGPNLDEFRRVLADDFGPPSLTRLDILRAALSAERNSIDCNAEIDMDARRAMYMRQIRDVFQGRDERPGGTIVFDVHQSQGSGVVIQDWSSKPEFVEWRGTFEGPRARIEWRFRQGQETNLSREEAASLFSGLDKKRGQRPAGFEPGNIQEQLLDLEKFFFKD